LDPSYPGPTGHTFSNNVVGIDFGVDIGNGSPLAMLDVGAEQNGLLDFTGAAGGKSGFSIYMVYHMDSLLPSPFGGNPNFNYLLANAPFANNAGPGIWYDGAGVIRADINGGGAGVAGSVPLGMETIISFNYDKATGNWFIANFNNGLGSGAGSGNDVAGNFSSNSFALGIGASMMWANFRTDGDFGEVVIYDRFISPTSAEHQNTVDALARKWFVPEPASVTLLAFGCAVCLLARRRRIAE
jgi:hypothetical protein